MALTSHVYQQKAQHSNENKKTCFLFRQISKNRRHRTSIRAAFRGLPCKAKQNLEMFFRFPAIREASTFGSSWKTSHGSSPGFFFSPVPKHLNEKFFSRQCPQTCFHQTAELKARAASGDESTWAGEGLLLHWWHSAPVVRFRGKMKCEKMNK